MQERQYIRHPMGIPIEAAVALPDGHSLAVAAGNVGQGGLAFHTPRGLDPGTRVTVRIPCTEPPFECEALVVWSHEHSGGAELGVQFLSIDDAFRARMVEQVCHIEDYRKETLEVEGRILSFEDAAAEWMCRHAAAFPAP